MPITAEDWYGNSENSPTLNDDLFKLKLRFRTVLLFPNASNRTVTLPDARKFVDIGWGVGRMVFVLANSGSFTVTVDDFGGTSQGVIPAVLSSPTRWHWAYLHLLLATTADGDWRFQLKVPS